MVYTPIVLRINTNCKLHIARIDFLLTFHLPPFPSIHPSLFFVYLPNVFTQTDRTHIIHIHTEPSRCRYLLGGIVLEWRCPTKRPVDPNTEIPFPKPCRPKATLEQGLWCCSGKANVIIIYVVHSHCLSWIETRNY